MTHYDETSRWMGWSKNEFLHRLGAAGNSRWPCQLRLIYEIVRHTFISTSCSAAVPELWTLGA